jgi:hypothetical protein
LTPEGCSGTLPIVSQHLPASASPGGEPDRARRRSAAGRESLRELVCYALVSPLARLARFESARLDELADLVEMAYFHELRRAGLRLREIAERLGISPRKAALLSKRLKRNFLRPDDEVGLARRLEVILWAEPQSEAQLCRALPAEDPGDVGRALETLVAQARVRRERAGRRDVYVREEVHAHLVGGVLASKLDALQNLLTNLAHVVHARFFADDARAFARTITFRVRERDLPRLEQAYRDLWQLVTELEADARSADDPLTLDLSILWAPFDYTPKREVSP